MEASQPVGADDHMAGRPVGRDGQAPEDLDVQVKVLKAKVNRIEAGKN